MYIQKTIFLKYNNFCSQYYIDILLKIDTKTTRKPCLKLESIVRIEIFYDWTILNILKKWKLKFLCSCGIEEFFIGKKIIFSKIKIYSKKNQEASLKNKQNHNTLIPVFLLIFSSISFSNLKSNLNLWKFFGLNLRRPFRKFIYKHNFILIKTNLTAIYLFRNLNKLSLSGPYYSDQYLLFRRSWKKAIIFTSKYLKKDLEFSKFLNILIYNFNINL